MSVVGKAVGAKDILQPMGARKKTALCVVGLGFYEPWISILRNGQEKTWIAANRIPEIQVSHVHAIPVSKFGITVDKWHEKARWHSKLSRSILKICDFVFLFPFLKWIPKIQISSRISLRDPVFEVRVPDMYPFVRWKEISYFNYFLTKTSHDYLITTTNSSYLNLKNIYKLIEELPQNQVFFGPEPYTNSPFISGSFRIFSRDVVEAIIMHRQRWNTFDLEDVGISKLIRKLGYSMSTIPLTNYASVSAIQLEKISFLRNGLHFRLKSGTHTNRNDVEIMKYLHSRITEETGQ